MKFNKIEAGCYGAENGMLIKKGWAGLWKIFFNDNQLTVCETLKEAKGWIEEHERETHMLENMKAQELAQKVSQMDADQVCSIVEETLRKPQADITGKKVIIKADADGSGWMADEMKRFLGKKATVRADLENGFVYLTGIDGIDDWQWSKDALEIIPQPEPEKKYLVTRHYKATGEDESMGIWLGYGMEDFTAGSGFLAGKFYKETFDSMYYATEQPQESSEPVAQENIQPEAEDATESISEPHSEIWELAHMYHIPECYNKETDSIIIEDEYFHCIDCFVFDLLRDQHDFILRCEELENYARIWHLERGSQKASQSSSEEEKEITQENAEELTESNPEPQGMAHHTRIKLNYSLSALRAMRAQHIRLKRNEYLANGNSQHYQDLIEKIEKLDEEIARREKE